MCGIGTGTLVNFSQVGTSLKDMLTVTLYVEIHKVLESTTELIWKCGNLWDIPSLLNNDDDNDDVKRRHFVFRRLLQTNVLLLVGFSLFM